MNENYIRRLVETVRAIEDCMGDPARWAETRLTEAGLLDPDRAPMAWRDFVDTLRECVIDEQGNPICECDDEDEVVETAKDLFEHREAGFQLFYCLFLLDNYSKKS